MPIVETAVLGVVLYRAIKCLDFGLGSLIKYKSIKRLVDRGKKEVTVRTEDGRAVTIFIDEFVEDGVPQVEISVREGPDGNAYVLTKAESTTLAKAEFIEKLVDSEVEMSSNGWKNVIRPLLKSVRSRDAEIRKSPGRRAPRRR